MPMRLIVRISISPDPDFRTVFITAVFSLCLHYSSLLCADYVRIIHSFRLFVNSYFRTLFPITVKVKNCPKRAKYGLECERNCW